MKCNSPYQRWSNNGLWREYPCGRCLTCRINRAEEWSTRILLELEDKTLEGDFITLTLNDSKVCPLLPMALSKRLLQNFFKRVRKAGNQIRYFACGEYGEKHRRAHYHAIIIHKKGETPNYEKHWNMGNCVIGTVTSASARYVTGYLTKSNTIPPGKERWPPFQLQSQGFGAQWAKKNRTEIYKELSWVPRYLTEKAMMTRPGSIETILNKEYTPVANLNQRRRNTEGLRDSKPK